MMLDAKHMIPKECRIGDTCLMQKLDPLQIWAFW